MLVTPRRALFVTLACVVALAVVALGALVVGVESIDVVRALTDPASNDYVILWETRAQRVVLGGAVGAALALAGVAFQVLLRNPLADPYVLGVSSGASVAATMVIVLGLGTATLGALAVPASAFGGAIAATVMVLSLGRVRGRLVPEVALLAGVMMNALASAVVVAIRLVSSPQSAHEALYWLTGSIGRHVETRWLVALLVYLALGMLLLYRRASAMNALVVGAEAAHTVGVDVHRTRRSLFLTGSLLTGAAVACAGPIGFVGILVPHLARALVGPDHRVLLPVAAFGGAAFLILADTVARLSFLWFGDQMTAGVVTALCGAPFFLVALRRRNLGRVG